MAIFTLVTFTACDDFLNVLPDQRVVLDSRDKIHRLLVSAYTDASFWLFTEFASDNADWNVGEYSVLSHSLDEAVFFWRQPDLLTQDSPHYFWNFAYRAIASANQALAAIERLESRGDYPHCLNHERGEALLARAYGHFKLVNIFSQHFSPIHSNTDLGIPFIDAPETTVNPQYERGTVAYVYSRIAQDIHAGINLIDDTRLTVRQYRFNRAAAAAFAARFYLYYGNWHRADSFATIALGSNPRLRNWEALGAISPNQNAARGNLFISTVNNPANLLLRTAVSNWAIAHGPFGNGARISLNSHINSTEIQTRGPWGTGNQNQWFAPIFTGFGQLPKAIMVKFTYTYFEFTDAIAQIGWRRLVQTDFTTDETLLVRAEARAMLGRFDDALADINIFMEAFAHPTAFPLIDSNRPYLGRRHFILEDFTTFYGEIDYYTWYAPTPKKRLNPDFDLLPGDQTNLIHGILHLRRILTVHEGLRWFDVKRWGIQIYRREVSGSTALRKVDVLPPRDPRRAFQIPEAVIGAGLEPNPRQESVHSVQPVLLLPTPDILAQ